MRSLLIVCAVACLSLAAGVATAAGPGEVPDATLASFGLGGMQRMNDIQGENIRGTGFAIVFGSGALNYFVPANHFAVSPGGFVLVPSGSGIAGGGAVAFAR
jgi:hypothetical protein